MYRVRFSKKAAKNLEKMDSYQAKLIYNWVAKNLENCKNPRAMGKPLAENLKGYWRYEVGSFRLICDIQDEVCIIVVVKVGHRREIYKK